MDMVVHSVQILRLAGKNCRYADLILFCPGPTTDNIKSLITFKIGYFKQLWSLKTLSPVYYELYLDSSGQGGNLSNESFLQHGLLILYDISKCGVICS